MTINLVISLYSVQQCLHISHVLFLYNMILLEKHILPPGAVRTDPWSNMHVCVIGIHVKVHIHDRKHFKTLIQVEEAQSIICTVYPSIQQLHSSVVSQQKLPYSGWLLVRISQNLSPSLKKLPFTIRFWKQSWSSF